MSIASDATAVFVTCSGGSGAGVRRRKSLEPERTERRGACPLRNNVGWNAWNMLDRSLRSLSGRGSPLMRSSAGARNPQGLPSLSTKRRRTRPRGAT
eukprot:364496-Chlamydomonas_euryale.AAC.9